MCVMCLPLILYLLMPVRSVVADELSKPQWIWAAEEQQADAPICLRTTFQISRGLEQAGLSLCADFCEAVVFINDQQVTRQEPYGQSTTIDVSEVIVAGSNVIAICCDPVDGPSAVGAILDLTDSDGKRVSISTSDDWQTCMLPTNLLHAPTGDGAKWRPVTTRGQVLRFSGRKASGSIGIRHLDNYEQWKQALDTASATNPSSLQVADGFEVVELRSAAEGEDSWTSLAVDEQGRWIVAKEQHGLLRFTLNAKSDSVVKAEEINDSLAECRGLLFTDSSLYAMANNDKALFRLRDTTGDDQFDQVERLAEFEGVVGHGRNQLTLGPDGMIYAIFGDSVYKPESAQMLPPKLSNPDRFERTRNGFVARTDKDGKHWEIVTHGLRNPFGIDFNRFGDMFTYDADAEYDMGSSWYRPTRINHLVLGGDFGWRRVTQEWPPYFPDRPDMPQPTLDTGKGSPTAVVFGTHSKFPPAYRDALFALDWAYGRILAVHLSPSGSSYAAHAETFLRGTPLNVTDAKFGPDGAMYFVTGGRATQSALYRVAYVGPTIDASEPSTQQRARQQHSKRNRIMRRQLESFCGKPNPDAIDIAWPLLISDDPWIRNAARTAIEWQPAEQWRSRGLNASDLDTQLAAMLALTRVGELSDRTSILYQLNAIDLADLSLRQKREAVFLVEKCLDEAVELTPDARETAFRKLDELYPSKSYVLNRRLSLLVAQANSPTLVLRTMDLLQLAQTPTEQFHYLYALRNASTGWTMELRETYFQYLAQTAEYVGGEGMPRFRELIESESLETVPVADRARFTKILKATSAARWLAESPDQQREFVHEWMLGDFGDLSSVITPVRDLENGKRMFSAARCIVCHRVGSRGGVVGPDLTSVASRFSPRDLLLSTIEPSKVISEKYQGETFLLESGQIISGRIIGSDFRSDSVAVVTNPLSAEEPTMIKKSEIESQQPSRVSPMPTGLLNTLSRDDVLDLVAWILDAGRD